MVQVTQHSTCSVLCKLSKLSELHIMDHVSQIRDSIDMADQSCFIGLQKPAVLPSAHIAPTGKWEQSPVNVDRASTLLKHHHL